MTDPAELSVQLSTLVPAGTTDPYVALRLMNGETEHVAIMLPPTHAREVALWLLECAEAVEQDVNTVIIMRSHKMEEPSIQNFLAQLRARRQTTKVIHPPRLEVGE